MNKPEIILIGAGGHAHACIDVIEQQGKFNIAGLVGSSDELQTRQFGYSVIGTDNDLVKLAKEYPNVLIAVGQIKSADIRTSLYLQAVAAGFHFPVIKSPRSYVSKHATIAQGTIVMHDVVINAGATIGSNCIINTRALIEHDVQVGDHCHVSTGAILNGGASMGTGSFLGSGGVVKQNVSLGKGCIVGMGVTVRHDLNDGVQFVGDNS